MSLIQPLFHGVRPGKVGGILKAAATKSKNTVKRTAKDYCRQQRVPRLEQCDRFTDSAILLAKKAHEHFPRVACEVTPPREAFLREFVRNRADDSLFAIHLVKNIENPAPTRIQLTAKEAIFQGGPILKRKFNNVKTGITQRNFHRILMY